jgi:hypothetical protein
MLKNNIFFLANSYSIFSHDLHRVHKNIVDKTKTTISLLREVSLRSLVFPKNFSEIRECLLANSKVFLQKRKCQHHTFLLRFIWDLVNLIQFDFIKNNKSIVFDH